LWHWDMMALGWIALLIGIKIRIAERPGLWNESDAYILTAKVHSLGRQQMFTHNNPKNPKRQILLLGTR